MTLESDGPMYVSLAHRPSSPLFHFEPLEKVFTRSTLYDSPRQDPESLTPMSMPSPTSVAHRNLEAATVFSLAAALVKPPPPQASKTCSGSGAQERAPKAVAPQELAPRAAAGEVCLDRELVSSVLQTVLGDDLPCMDALAMEAPAASASYPLTEGAEHRWWTKYNRPLTCALTGFPINLLPYPPFKLRAESHAPNPYLLVDGKFLALTMIVNPATRVCGRKLQASDLRGLDSYIRRCKLGPFKPARLQELQLAAASASTPEERAAQLTELTRFRGEARTELSRLRKIQETRLLHLACGEVGKRSQKARKGAVANRGARK